MTAPRTGQPADGSMKMFFQFILIQQKLHIPPLKNKINKKKASVIINKNYDWILNKLKDFQKKNEQMFLIDIFNFNF